MAGSVEGTWSTSVSELMQIFRESLAALVPVVEKARVPWREGDAYDDWDSIATSLYENLVARSLEYADEVGPIPLAAYDMSRDDYRGVDFIAVRAPGINQDVTAAFVRFAGTSPPFEAVDWVSLKPDFTVADASGRVAASDCRFHLLRHVDRREDVHRLTVSV